MGFSFGVLPNDIIRNIVLYLSALCACWHTAAFVAYRCVAIFSANEEMVLQDHLLIMDLKIIVTWPSGEVKASKALYDGSNPSVTAI